MNYKSPEKFKIIEMIKDLITAIDKYLVNFPNKEIELKRKIKECAYDLLYITYEANITIDENKRRDLQEKGVAHIKLLDFLVNQCYDKEIINAKRYFRFGESLDNIVRYYAGWINSYKKEIGNKP